jgi:hypothetical protein
LKNLLSLGILCAAIFTAPLAAHADQINGSLGVSLSIANGAPAFVGSTGLTWSSGATQNNGTDDFSTVGSGRVSHFLAISQSCSRLERRAQLPVLPSPSPLAHSERSPRPSTSVICHRARMPRTSISVAISLPQVPWRPMGSRRPPQICSSR